MAEVYQKILFIQTAYLGDLFLSIPTIKNIKKLYPHAQLALLVKKGLGDFFLKNNLADLVFEVDKKSRQSLSEQLINTKKFTPDLVISAHQSFRTALWVSKLKAKKKIGFFNFYTFWAYDQTVKRDLKVHDVLRQLSLLKILTHEKLSDDMIVKVQDAEKMQQFKNYIALAPGSQWETKKWPIENYKELIKKLQNHNHLCVLVGGVNEEHIGKEIEKENLNLVNLIGKTNIQELAMVLQNVKLLVSNDSGAMHVASSQGTPVVSIFGPTIPGQGYAPWNKKSKIIEISDLQCRPCGAHGHSQCPLKTHDCMKLIKVDNVMNELQEYL